jgi:hypothetical protein
VHRPRFLRKSSLLIGSDQRYDLEKYPVSIIKKCTEEADVHNSKYFSLGFVFYKKPNNVGTCE